MSTASTSSIIPFDSGKSYVVRGLPVKNDVELRFTDKLGRTKEDLKFLEQFERIFLAAAYGDIKTCQTIVEGGYCDVEAFSVGKFVTSSGDSLDNLSPLQIAQQRKYAEIVELFQKVQSKSKETSSKQQEFKDIDFLQAKKIESEVKSHLGNLNPTKASPNVQYECIKTKEAEPLLVYNVSFWTDDKQFTANLYDNTIRIVTNLGPNNSTFVTTLVADAHQGQIHALYVQGDRCFSASEDKTLKAWDANTGKLLNTFVGHTSRVNCVRTHKDSLISGSGDKSIKIWDMDTGECVKTLDGHDNAICTLIVHEKWIISGSWDKTIRIWDIETGECCNVLCGHTDWVNTLLVDNNLVYSGSDDKTIKIWDMETGECLNTLTGYKYGIYQLAIEGGKLLSDSKNFEESKTWALKS